MSDPAYIPIIADRRVDNFETWSFLGVDYTGSSFKIQVRLVKDTTGTPLMELSTGSGNFSILYAGTATIAAHIAAGRLTAEIKDSTNPATGVAYADGDSVLLTQLRLGIAAVNIPSLTPAQTGDDLAAFYDIIRTPAAGSAEIIMRGTFTIRAGVTIP